MREQREISNEINVVATRLRKLRSKPARERSPVERVIIRITRLQLRNLRLVEKYGNWAHIGSCRLIPKTTSDRTQVNGLYTWA
jgi:hypothetical protein